MDGRKPRVTGGGRGGGGLNIKDNLHSGLYQQLFLFLLENDMKPGHRDL